MKLEVFKNYSDIDFDRARCLSFKAEPFSSRKEHIFEDKFRLDPKQACLKLFEKALWFWRPALDLYLVLSWLKWDHAYAVAGH